MDFSTIDALNWSLVDQYFKLETKNFDFEESMIKTLVQDQKYDLIISFLQRGFSLTSNIIDIIRRLGNLKLYQYLYSIQRLKLDSDLTQYAARNNDIKTLIWLQEKGCPRNELIYIYAAENGHLKVLKWLRENGMPWNELICIYAAENGHLEILEWLLENEYPYFQTYVCSFAAKGGHLSVLKWARENGLNWDETTCVYAAENGQLEILKWCRSQHPPCPWNKWTCIYASQKEQWEILKWSINHGCPMDHLVCAYLFKNGGSISKASSCQKLKMLKWLRKNGCPWNKTTCESAAQNGHLNVLKWAIQKGCPYNLNRLKKLKTAPEIKAYLDTL